MNESNRRILKNGKRVDFAIIIAITLIFLFMMAINVRLIFRMTSNQTEEIGQMQLEAIRSDFQNSITKAENTTFQTATEVDQLLKAGTSRENLREFFYRTKAEQKNLTDGVCFNVYVTGLEWTIIPDFDMPAEYHAPERIWYKGAAANPDALYISEPYIDAMTGEMCFTMSKMLPDKETVVALDFTFSDVQRSIVQMSSSGGRKALIVTKTGTIIGYTDMSLVGEKVSKKLPEYEAILSRVVQSDKHESFTTNINGGEHTIFSSATANGWYMILSVDNYAFYRDSYRQIFFTILLSLMMMLAIIFFYLNALKNRLQAQTALRVREEFLSRMNHELRDPLKKILDASSVEVLKSNTNPADKAAEIRESALKLSNMLDNLFSFSTIVSRDKKVAKIFRDRDLAKISRYARTGIITVLVAAMAVAFTICLTTTIDDGDKKMNLEVDNYEHQLANWLEKQRAILNMFVNLVGERPELMDDYPAAVKFLNDLAKHYPEISVCYLANPYKTHNVIMNNGWESTDPNWHVDKRPWYIEAENSEDGFSVSAPYYDAQTGLYCVTLAQVVYNPQGEFVGIFAIDFYLDRLTQVLGESYTKDGYAFLVDRNGIIINHPNADYQQSVTRMTDISGTEYSEVFYHDGVDTVKDYTGNFVACLAKKNKTSQFTVVVANNWWNIYGNIIALAILSVILLGICVVIVNVLINRLLRWQESVNSQLKDASDTALAASQAKSQFLAQMSHEIRTPINAVLGMNEMILRESDSDEVLDYAANIQTAGKNLLTLINSILDFSKIEDGKMEIIPVRYETAALIDDSINMISERARKKSLDFKTEIDPALPKVLYGDDVRVRQIITNILSNAVKYTHKGSVTLKIGGSEIDADTFELQVSVSDTGIGIRAEDMDKLFQSFLRLDEERNRNIEGTGLGISIVQKLLSMMNSKLEVQSVYGEGSTFSFRLIQKIVDRTPVGNHFKSGGIWSNTTKFFTHVDGKKFLVAADAKILVVDDNEMNLKVAGGLLRRNKITPDFAESGRQCIELAKKNFYHVIFLDNMMPVMNGVETLKTLRRDKILSNKTVVIMLSASATAGMREQYLREGFDDYLSKPIDVVELETVLEKHLPSELVSFEFETRKKSMSKKNNSAPVAEQKTFANADSFSADERKIFAETCPNINLDVGLKYCMDSKSFFTQMLTAFTDEKRAEKIQDAFDADDVKNYQILVHALKSTSLSIGAEHLSEQAKILELAAKDNDVEKIRDGHAALMALYQKVREEINHWLEAST